MKHDQPTEVYQEKAVSFALGILDSEEKQLFEEHLQGCAACDADTQSFRELVGSLALGVTAVDPPTALRNRLMGAVFQSPASQALNIVRTSLLPWKSVRSRIWEKSLSVDAARRRTTRLIRLEPGGRIRSHRHTQDEESFVLEGSAELSGLSFHPGDYHRAPSGSIHASYVSTEGCVFLLFSGTEYEFFENERPQEPGRLTSIGSGAGEWHPLEPGVLAKTLFSSEPFPQATALLQMQSGATSSLEKAGVLEAFVLEGHAQINSESVSQGDYFIDAPTSAPRNLNTAEGCLLLIHSY